MSVWLAIPSKRTPEEAAPVLSMWRERGYKIALFTDTEADAEAKSPDLFCSAETDGTPYPGYAVAVNRLVKTILEEDTSAVWIVTGGDDVQPSPDQFAYEISAQCWQHFRGSFGVMQPTGDRWGVGDPGPWPKDSAYIDRVCGSPWMGRAFCERINQGRGPLREEFRHMFVDEALQEIAIKYGCLWQRRDLTHYHQHWARRPGTDANECPDFLRTVNSPEHWKESREIFDRLKAAGWPGSEPL